MKRLLSCLTIGLLLATPFAASADDNRHRDGHDRDFRHRQFDNRFQDRRFERNFGDHGFDRRFGDRHFDRSARLSHRNEPWRGHRGWSDYGGVDSISFTPGRAHSIVLDRAAASSIAALSNLMIVTGIRSRITQADRFIRSRVGISAKEMRLRFFDRR